MKTAANRSGFFILGKKKESHFIKLKKEAENGQYKYNEKNSSK